MTTATGTGLTPEDQAATIELKPCPHCGGKASQPENYGDHPHYPGRFINCSKCGASVYRANLACGEHDINLIAAWNARAESATIAELRERLREADSLVNKYAHQYAEEQRRCMSAEERATAAERALVERDAELNALAVTVARKYGGPAPIGQALAAADVLSAAEKWAKGGYLDGDCNALMVTVAAWRAGRK